MNRNLTIVLLAVFTILLVLPACTRSAPQSTGVATPTEAIFPAMTTDPIMAIQTQTAAALPPAPTNTVEVAVTAPAPEATVPSGGGDPTAGGGDAGGGLAATATAPAAASNPIPPITRPATHTIEKGEFPYCIARRYDLDPGSFMSLNGLSNSSQVSVGTVLQIPSTGSWNTTSLGSRALRTHPTTYTVGAGDTVPGIACKFGDVSPEQILAANNFSSTADVQAGATIQIP